MRKIPIFFAGTIFLTAILAISAFRPLPPGSSANGQGTLNLPYMNGVPQHFSFHANTDKKGNVSGKFESKSPGQEIRIHGNITCLNILPDGKTAVMQGVVTQAKDNGGFGIVAGSIIYFSVQDNGEGSNAAPDQFSDYFGPVGNFNCFDFGVPLNPITGGNIQVKP